MPHAHSADSRSEALIPCAQPPVHLKLRGRVDDGTERLAIRAALGAAHLFGLATGSHLRSLRGSKDLVADQQARLEEANLRARLAWEIVEILIHRFQKIPDKHRPYYAPTSRFRILELKSLLGWSAKQAARVFLVCPNTILNWERHADPDAKAVGSTVKPSPPIRRLADVVRNLAQTMARLGCGGQDMIAAILARAGWKLSARSVRRFVKERPAPAPAMPPARPQRPVVARFVNHVWMMDVTIVKSFLGLSELHVAGVFDAFSRVPLSLQVFDTRPKASDMVRLLRPAIKPVGQPKYPITDLGSEFTGRILAKTVSRLGIVQRFASRHNLYATARALLENPQRHREPSTPAPPHPPGSGTKARTDPRPLPAIPPAPRAPRPLPLRPFSASSPPTIVPARRPGTAARATSVSSVHG